MRSCWANILFSSMLILTSLTAPLASLTTFSIIGCKVLHGPHHGAQKSTTIGTVRDASSTSLANLFWSLSLMRSAGAACGAAPVNIVSIDPQAGDFRVACNVAPVLRRRKGWRSEGPGGPLNHDAIAVGVLERRAVAIPVGVERGHRLEPCG